MIFKPLESKKPALRLVFLKMVPDSESTFHYNWLYLKILIEFDFIYTLFCTLGPFGGFC